MSLDFVKLVGDRMTYDAERCLPSVWSTGVSDQVLCANLRGYHASSIESEGVLELFFCDKKLLFIICLTTVDRKLLFAVFFYTKLDFTFILTETWTLSNYG